MARLIRNLNQLFKYRVLIQSLVGRDLKARYRGTVLGFVWSFLNPLLLMLVYTVVFALILKPRDPLFQQPADLRPLPLQRPPALAVVPVLDPGVVRRPDGQRQPDQEDPLPGRGPAGRHGHRQPGQLPLRPAHPAAAHPPVRRQADPLRPLPAAGRRRPVCLLPRLCPAHLGPDRPFPRHPRHPEQPHDPVVLLDAGHLLAACSSPSRNRRCCGPSSASTP